MRHVPGGRGSAGRSSIARLCRCVESASLTALGLCAEIGGWRRFDRPDSLPAMSGSFRPSTPPARPGGWAWRVQLRLNARGNLLRNGRGKPAGVVTIPIARVLVGACWEVATA